jgi:hypothetical protein
LINPNIPELIEKIIMLTSGYYLDVKLFFDDFQKENDILWKPNQKTIYRIWKLNNKNIKKEQWQTVFPHKFEYIDHLYQRAEGKFVPFSKPRVNLRDPRHWLGRINTGLYRSAERSRIKIQEFYLALWVFTRGRSARRMPRAGRFDSARLSERFILFRTPEKLEEGRRPARRSRFSRAGRAIRSEEEERYGRPGRFRRVPRSAGRPTRIRGRVSRRPGRIKGESQRGESQTGQRSSERGRG